MSQRGREVTSYRKPAVKPRRTTLESSAPSVGHGYGEFSSKHGTWIWRVQLQAWDMDMESSAPSVGHGYGEFSSKHGTWIWFRRQELRVPSSHN
ncbi:hypothetical protein J6590_045303 [Homalodisca vitripennis]|nr:hypothetical protein J6590_045303 [Homalodisca vitripennis]